MDLSPWHNFKFCKISETKQLYYKKYYHKIVYKIKGAHLFTLINNGSNAHDQLNRKIERFHEAFSINNADCQQLHDFLSFYVQRKSLEARFRIERSTVAIFHNDLTFLYNLANGDFKKYSDKLREMTTYFDESTKSVLDKNGIIVKAHTDHLYRVNIRNYFFYKKYDNERRALGNYLKEIGEEVKITIDLLQALEGNNKYFTGSYFHVKDPNIVSMIMLITPNLIKSVQQLVVK
jgi:hypothetical protein